MNHILLFIILLAGHNSILAQSSNLTIIIRNIDSDKGQIIVGLHNNSENFPKKAYIKKLISIKDNKATVSFRDIPNGIYAVSILHDVNNNGKIDFNFFHFPKEKTAASNNAKGFFGPPDFEDAKFIVDKDIELTISFK